jgi:putative hydrolase of the HAD superfamily
MRIHTLVFDLDDTLYRESEYVISGMYAAGRWLKSQHDIDGFAAVAVGLFNRGVRKVIFDEALQILKVDSHPVLVAQLLAVYRSHKPVLTLLPDAVDCIKWAKDRFRLALLTDGYQEVQRNKIKALELEREFPCMVLTDELGSECWKPSPVGFRQIMSTFDGNARGYVYIADNPRKDFIAPLQLGWRTIRIKRTGCEYASCVSNAHESPEYTICSLHELEELLEPDVSHE